MKIDTAKGSPIWLSPRPGNGITVIQGTSRIMLSAQEISLLIDALTRMANAETLA